MDDVLYAYSEPSRLASDYALYISRQVKTFQLLSVKDLTIQEYLTSLNYSDNDFLCGKIGPEIFRKFLWNKNKNCISPTLRDNLQRFYNVTDNNKKIQKHVNNNLNDDYIICLIPIDNLMNFYSLWNILKEIKKHFKLPYEISVEPVKKLSRILKSALKHLPKLSKNQLVSETNWIFSYFLVNKEQEKNLKNLLDRFKTERINLPIFSIISLIYEFQSEIIKIKTSRFLKDSIPISEFARYCVLIRHSIFSNKSGSRHNLVLFWNEIWNEWENSTDEEKSKKMLDCGNIHRSWADDDELRLFVASSGGSEEETDLNFNDYLINSNTSSQDSGLELISECEEENENFEVNNNDNNKNNIDSFNETTIVEDSINLTKQSSSNDSDNSINSSIHTNINTTVSSLATEAIDDNEMMIGDTVFDEISERLGTLEPESSPITKNESVKTILIDDVNDSLNLNDCKFSSSLNNESYTLNGLIVNDENNSDNRKSLDFIESTIIESDDKINLNNFNPELTILDNDFNEKCDSINKLNENFQHNDDFFSNDLEMEKANQTDIEDNIPDNTEIKSFNGLPKQYDLTGSPISITESYIEKEFKQPGQLTAILDISSSESSRANSIGFNDIDSKLESSPSRSIEIPDKIELYEKLSGTVPKHLKHLHHTQSNEEFSLKKTDQDEDVKHILKPVAKRADTGTVLKLKNFIETKPELVSLKEVEKFDNFDKSKNQATSVRKGRSISEIFAALLDDNMKDLCNSAEYRNKVVRPQDLYNRIKIDTDKPWDKLSKRTKEKYYGAFLRKYDNELNRPEKLSLVLDVVDILELVKVCVDFGDVKHNIVKYAIHLVENLDDLKNSNSEDSSSEFGDTNSIHSIKLNRNKGGSSRSLNNLRGMKLNRNSSASSIIMDLNIDKVQKENNENNENNEINITM